MMWASKKAYTFPFISYIWAIEVPAHSFEHLHPYQKGGPIRTPYSHQITVPTDNTVILGSIYMCSISDLNAGMTLLLDARNSRTHSPTKHLLEKLVVSQYTQFYVNTGTSYMLYIYHNTQCTCMYMYMYMYIIVTCVYYYSACTFIHAVQGGTSGCACGLHLHQDKPLWAEQTTSRTWSIREAARK